MDDVGRLAFFAIFISIVLLVRSLVAWGACGLMPGLLIAGFLSAVGVAIITYVMDFFVEFVFTAFVPIHFFTVVFVFLLWIF